MTKRRVKNFSYLLKLGLLLPVLITLSCKENVKTENAKANPFYTIPFSEIIKNKSDVKLSDFASDAKIIQLENIPEALLGTFENIEFTKDYFFIMCWAQPVLEFSRTGKFIRQIGRMGKGPEEYFRCLRMSVDEKDERVYVQTTESSMMVYNFAGEYIKTIKYPALGSFRLNYWSRDSLFVSYAEPMMGNEPYVFMEHNEQGDTLQTIANHIFWENEEFAGVSPFEEQNFTYRYDNKLHMKGCYNDTVYTYNENNKIVPEFLIDLGTHKLPDDLIYQRKWKRSLPNDLCWTGVYETSNYIFIPYGYHFDQSKPETQKKEKGCILYNKKTKQGVAVKETKQGGFIDDIAGGPDFRPIVTNDSTAVMLVSALEMKQYLNSDQFKNKKIKSPAEKEKLAQLAKTLNEEDNHFLVVVDLKK